MVIGVLKGFIVVGLGVWGELVGVFRVMTTFVLLFIVAGLACDVSETRFTAYTSSFSPFIRPSLPRIFPITLLPPLPHTLELSIKVIN